MSGIRGEREGEGNGERKDREKRVGEQESEEWASSLFIVSQAYLAVAS